MVELFSSLGLPVNPRYLTRKLREYAKELNREDSDSTKLNEEEFLHFFDRLWTNGEIVLIMKGFASNGVYTTVEDLEFFLMEVQGKSDGTRYCEEIINYYEPTVEGRRRKELGIDGLILYLLSTANDVFNPNHDKVYQDMTQPATHYFIASSHSTFLTGDQLAGESSVQAYVDALKLGCRCVEIDCLDGDDNEPVVYHGHTLTSRILFRDVISAVNDHAFNVTPYPLILSLQIRCNVETQKKMARYMKEILEDKLYTESVDTNLNTFPSPEFFKNKILLKSKKLKPELEQAHDVDEGDVTDSDDEESTQYKGRKQGKSSSGSPAFPPGYSDSRSNLEETQAPRELEKPKSPKQSNKLKLAQELSKVVNYVTAAHFKNLEYSKAENANFNEISSFNEYRTRNFLEKARTAREFTLYNMRQLSRVYPGFLRVDSSNYDPQPPWNIGCQIVALNYQNEGRELHLNHGRFRPNGRSGCVLKPRALRDPALTYNPNTKREILGVDRKVLKLTIVSGQQLSREEGSGNTSKEEPDAYVKVEVNGIPADCFSYRTKTIKDNGLNPVWNETFEKTLLVPELAMIRFEVSDDDFGFDDCIGQNSVPFSSLRSRYCCVSLLRDSHTPLGGATLLVQVEVSDALIMHSGSAARKHSLLSCVS